MTGPISIEGPTTLTCEILVIGTGAGGASAAATLADAGVNVFMLEEGPHVPADVAPRGLSEALPALWRGGGLTATTGGSPIALAEGRCVGGGTEINSAIFQRAPDEVVESWARANDLPDFSPQALAPLYDRAASDVNASLTPGTLGPPTEILQRAGEVMGWKTTALERGRRESSSPRHQVSGFATGAKQSMSATLIPRALLRGARLLANCRVDRLAAQGRRVTGAFAMATDAQGRRHRVTVNACQVFLCAGTTQTPSILQRSGIRKNIGRSFQLHPTIRVLATFPEAVNAHRHELPLAAITEFMPGLRFGGSVFTLSTFGLAVAEDWQVRRRYLPEYAHCAMYYAMIRPDGVGRVRTVPGLTEPILSYGLTERDWRRLRDFCLMSSAVYIFNDWRDMDADCQHSKKASRPLPSGRVPVPVALAVMTALIIAAVAIIYLTHLPKSFAAATAVYLAINIGYSLGIKHVSVLELFFVASGFVIRLIGGGYALQIQLSPWIVIATGMLALLMATGKRRGDIAQSNDSSSQRRSLAAYTLGFLNSTLTALTGGTIVVYLLFCVSEYAVARFGASVLITSLPVALGLLRYLQLIMVHGHGKSPTDLVLGDRGTLAILAVFGAAFAYLIYF